MRIHACVRDVLSPAGPALCASEYVTAGLGSVRLYYNHDEYPDESPIYGCALNGGVPDNCVATRRANSYSMASEGAVTSGNAGFGFMSSPITDFVRFHAVWLQLELDAAYNDVSSVDVWFPPTGSVATNATLAAYASNLTVWLSPTPTYNSSGALTCVSDWSPVAAPGASATGRARADCGGRTTNATRYVSLVRPLSAALGGALYVHEVRVVRAGE